MPILHPLTALQGYRLGSRQATVELQREDTPNIHVDFKVLSLIDEIKTSSGRAVILTGTAGDGKTYLAYRAIDALGLSRAAVREAQPLGGYEKDGVFIDLDLSAGALTDQRIQKIHEALSAPKKLTLLCANEGKLAELQQHLGKLSLALPENALQINLSRRSLAHPVAWSKILSGVLDAEFWPKQSEASPLTWNQAWLRRPEIADRLRRYLLVPFLLGEPITIRETLSLMAYALGGGASPEQADSLAAHDRIKYLLFNTLFGEPDGYAHGERATPNEKLLWWLFRCDPADQASPTVDLQLLVELDRLGAVPEELSTIWKKELVVYETEKNDNAYRQRLTRFMRYARRWYALSCDEGFRAYFPFKHFSRYLALLTASPEERLDEMPSLLRGLNLLLSGGKLKDYESQLMVFYLAADGTRQRGAIYNYQNPVDISELSLVSDIELDNDARGDGYVERLPRKLYLQYDPEPTVRMPLSLLLYEVLSSAASAAGGFPATLWAKERDTVVRFMGALNRAVPTKGATSNFELALGNDPSQSLKISHNSQRKLFTVI